MSEVTQVSVSDLEAWSKALYRMIGRGLRVPSIEIYKRLHMTADAAVRAKER